MPEVDISTLANNIRANTISESHKNYSPAEQVAVEIQNGLAPIKGYLEMEWLTGTEQAVSELEQAVEKWINETPGAEKELEEHGFGAEERRALFEKIRNNIKDRNRPNT